MSRRVSIAAVRRDGSAATPFALLRRPRLVAVGVLFGFSGPLSRRMTFLPVLILTRWEETEDCGASPSSASIPAFSPGTSSRR